jgi:hypothetical protein
MPIKPHNGDRWPPKVKIYIYDEDSSLIDESKHIRYDLSDNLMLSWPDTKRTVYLGMETLSANWPIWDDESLKCVEARIKYDLNFDGNDVVITRITKTYKQPCSKEFIWKLDISEDVGDESQE